MQLVLIGVHYSAPDKKEITGFRLIDADNGQVGNQPYNAVEKVVASNRAPIAGIEYDIKSKKLKGSNGSFDRYPALVGGMPMNNPLIILASIDDAGFKVCNFEGCIV